MYSPVGTLPMLKNAASRWAVVWNRIGMSSQLNLEKLRRETGRDEPTSDKKVLLVNCHQGGWCVEGEGP
jgi:hypothetical protein